MDSYIVIGLGLGLNAFVLSGILYALIDINDALKDIKNKK